MDSDGKSLSQQFESSIGELKKMSAENKLQLDAANSFINNSASQAIVDKVRNFFCISVL